MRARILRMACGRMRHTHHGIYGNKDASKGSMFFCVDGRFVMTTGRSEGHVTTPGNCDVVVCLIAECMASNDEHHYR